MWLTYLNVPAHVFHPYEFCRFRALAQFGCTNADIFLDIIGKLIIRDDS